MFREAILTFMDNFLAEKEQFYASPSPRVISNYVTHAQFKERIPNVLHSLANIPKSGYKIQGSIGTGNMSAIPWLAVFDKNITSNAQNGYYIVYLFQADMSGVYLSLNQGWTQYRKTYNGIKQQRLKLTKNTDRARMLLRSTGGFSQNKIDLKFDGSLAEGYELGDICNRYYSVDNIPYDDVLIDDLRNMIGVYRELKGLVGPSILNINTVSEEDYQSQIQTGEGVQLPSGKIVKKEKSSISIAERWQRNQAIAHTALINANYKCEVNPTHETFINKKSNNPFMEAHHLIPLEFQDDFDCSIDVPENIISLCPNCHRAIHHSKNDQQKSIIIQLFDKRVHQLKDREIGVGIKKLFEYYEILEELSTG